MLGPLYATLSSSLVRMESLLSQTLQNPFRSTLTNTLVFDRRVANHSNLDHHIHRHHARLLRGWIRAWGRHSR